MSELMEIVLFFDLFFDREHVLIYYLQDFVG